MTQEREQWLEERRRGIGGSDIAAIMGLNPYKSALSVYYDKIGENKSSEENIPAEVGLELESYLRRKFVQYIKREEGIDIEVFQYEAGNIPHREHGFIRANPDGMFIHPDKGDCGLELKTAGERQGDKWQEGEIPDSYYLQCQHYMAVMGWQWMAICCLLANRKIIVEWVPRNEEVIKAIIDTCKVFWHEHVLKKEPPAPMGMDADRDVLGRLYQPEDGKVVDLSDKLSLYDEYKGLSNAAKSITERIELIKQLIMADMQDAEIAQIGDHKATWKTVERKGYTVEPSKSRVFRIY